MPAPLDASPGAAARAGGVGADAFAAAASAHAADATVSVGAEGDGVVQIAVRGLRARGRHGVLDHEQQLGQEFVVDVLLDAAVGAATRTDRLVDTVDYGGLGRRVVEVVEGEPVQLIERLAQRVADVCLDDARVRAAEVTVHKPSAPMPVLFDDVSVTIRRSRA